MNFKYFLLLSLSIITSINILAQNDSVPFNPSGKVFGTSYFDYSTGLNSTSNTSGFDITRALLGYRYQFTKSIEATIAIDGAAGKSTDDKVEVHVRNAFVTWADQGFNIDLGIMTLSQFSLQQNMWGHRYALQSQQDLADMGHSVDIGILASYNFSPILSADVSITNGEGYKKIRRDKSMRYSVGTSWRPIDNFVFRLYGDIYTSDRDQFNKLETNKKMMNQFTYSAFIGYESSLLSGGVEYNKQLHNAFVRGNHIHGASVFSTVNLNAKWNVYARYDYYGSSNYGVNESWYDDKQMVVAGVEFKPFDFLRFSPNFRNINYKTRFSEQYLFVSGEFNF